MSKKIEECARCAAALTSERGYAARYCEMCRDYSAPRGMTIYTMLQKRNSAGTSRHFRVLGSRSEEIWDMSRFASEALGWRLSKDGNVIASGGGMNMGYYLVHNLGLALYRDGAAFEWRAI